MKRGSILTIAAVLLLAHGQAAGQSTGIIVRKGPAERPKLAVGTFTGGSGGEFARIVRNDLSIAGWFEMTSPAAADYVLAGSADGTTAANAAGRIFVGQGSREIFGRAYRGGDLRVLAHAFSDDVVRELTGQTGIASTRIAFVSNRTRHKELYLMDYDGANVRQLTQDRSIGLAPAWAPNGRHLFYTSFRGGWPDLYMIDIAGGRRRRVAAFPGLNSGASVSPDGQWIALTLSMDGNPELYLLPVAGGAPRRLTRTPRAGEASPAWSPDGRRIAFVSDMAGTPQIYVIPAEGGTPERLTGSGSENVEPDWSRASGLLAYATRRGGRYQIATMNPDTRKTTLISPPDADYNDPSWAPNGVHLVCGRSVRYASQLAILDTRGSRPVNVTQDLGDCYSPAWSP